MTTPTPRVDLATINRASEIVVRVGDGKGVDPFTSHFGAIDVCLDEESGWEYLRGRIEWGDV